MDLDYSGKHSINFYRTINNVTYKRNSWKDFRLVPKQRPKINYPEPRYMMVGIPGTSKRMDITDFHIGGLIFGGRTGTWEFYIDHSAFPGTNWKDHYDIIQSFLHGQEAFVTLQDEPTLFYSGIFQISDYKPGGSYSEITIQYDLNYDSFIRTEVSVSGLNGEVSLLTYSPIKFIGDNGISYAGDYGFTGSTSYITDLTDGNKSILAYDLTAMNSGG